MTFWCDTAFSSVELVYESTGAAASKHTVSDKTLEKN